MKFTFSLIFSVLFLSLNSQSIQESRVSLSVGSQSAYVVNVEGADEKMTEKVWKDYVKKMDAKVKRNKKANEYYTEKVRVNGVNNGTPIDLYMKVFERKGLVEIYIAADRGDAFISSNDTPDDTESMMYMVELFSYELERKVTEEILEDQEDILKDLQKDLTKLEDKNEDYHNDIRKAEEKIREAEEKIEVNLRDQDEKRIQIAKQTEAVEAIMAKYNSIGKN
jgi:hypothetical protein